MAILVFLTPANTVVYQDVIEYAESKKVKVYQMFMYHSYIDQTQLKLEKPIPLTKPSRHRFGHIFTPIEVSCPWDRPIIDPDTGFPIYED
ncbi:MAG: hypothetical protein AAF587_35135 [Bacteroidota bacterium]